MNFFVNFSGGGYMPGILDYIEVLTPIFLKIFSLLARCTVEKCIFLLEELNLTNILSY
jgi:hypothetical protein